MSKEHQKRFQTDHSNLCTETDETDQSCWEELNLQIGLPKKPNEKLFCLWQKPFQKRWVTHYIQEIRL